ncbi:co-chaperone protein daf-41-like [Anneissia japonica]|uniref:co-chaperone protein daf-41-like n=1 Tax=Anneissia japonica TaxID=1529436 RepID=UPI00142586DC|nr:co-chaperone protein daf-41-like [Anneissia japonica]
MTDAALHPQTLWAQRKDKLYITISVEDFNSSKVEMTDDQLIVEGKGGAEQKLYKLDFKFYGQINEEKSHVKRSSREVFITIVKKESGPYWPRLLSDKTKLSYLKTDFNRWVDEDDSDDEDSNTRGMGGMGGGNLEQMMAQMGGGGGDGFPGLGDLNEGGSEDSDDEELPDLEDDTPETKS